MPPEISVVIPTRNRPEKLHRTIDSLRCQSLPREGYEIIVVDDGSDEPVNLGDAVEPDNLRLLRVVRSERSSARNRGAETATAEIVAFVDDDVITSCDLVRVHLEAQREWPGVLAVGAVSLPQSVLRTPFGRFRAALERRDIPLSRGIVSQPNFCTAGNMSLSRQRFLALGGFDREIVSAEDQDLALRHTATGGRIAFIPEAAGVHDDESLDIRSYCRRTEWGAENMIPFMRRHPWLPANRARVAMNGPARWRQDSHTILGKKAVKAVLSNELALQLLFAAATVAERLSPRTRAATGLYRLLLGIHLQRGFRRGWARERGSAS